VSIPPPNTRSLRLVFEQKIRRLASSNICLIDAWKPQGGRAVRQVVFTVKFYSLSHDAVIRLYDDAGNVIETHEHGAISKSRKFFPSRQVAVLCKRGADTSGVPPRRRSLPPSADRCKERYPEIDNQAGQIGRRVAPIIFPLARVKRRFYRSEDRDAADPRLNQA
jgi:hypothetical protein